MASLKPPFRANDMKGLYNKVQKGITERIPLKFSNDLAGIINKCLQVNPTSRPTCDQLETELANFVKSGNENGLKEEKKALLQTIKLPKNMRLLQDKLPKANYQKKPANEMENLYSPSISNQSRQRVLSAGVRRVESNQDLNKKQENIPSKPQESASNQILIKKTPPPELNYGNYYQSPKPQPMQLVQKNINNNNIYNNPLPPRPGQNNPNIISQPKILNNNPYNYNNLNVRNPSPINNNKSPMNNNNALNSRERQNSRGSNSRENSRERGEIIRSDRPSQDIKKLEEKIAAKEKNLIGNNIFSNNDDLKRKYNEIMNQPIASNNNYKQPNSNANPYKSPVNDLKKYYEEKKVDAPKISKVNSKDFGTPLVSNTPKSVKQNENMAAGQFVNGNRVAKPSWWG